MNYGKTRRLGKQKALQMKCEHKGKRYIGQGKFWCDDCEKGIGLFD